MSFRGVSVVTLLVTSAMLATTAGNQALAESPSLAERMGAIRRGWAQDEDTTPNGANKNANTAKPKSQGDSLMPAWLGGRNNQQANSQGMNQPKTNNSRSTQTAGQPNGAGQTQARAGSAQHVASRPQTGGAQTNRSEGFTLPGLGGSPLPQAERAATQNTATKNNSNSTANDPNYPVIRDIAPSNPSAAAGKAASSQPQNGAVSSRQSPASHVTPKVDTEQLRRELAGGFSNSSNDGPVARTARANDRPAATSPTAEPSTTAPPTAANATPAKETNRSSPNPAGAQANSLPHPRQSMPMPQSQSASRGKEAFGEALQVINGGDPSVLVSNQTPVIASDIRGPKQILVGREALFRVRLQNQSDIAAEQVVAAVRIPAWAEVVGTTPTQGSVQPSQNANTPTQLEWHLMRLEPRGSEVLEVKLIPRESKPLELGITWTLAPVGSRAVVEVQEAKLKIEVDGPNEVLFDKPQVFQLRLSNPGTGLAENVRIDLIPPGATQETATSHKFGDLQPGVNKTIEIELTAREAGKLMVKAIAAAEGGLVSEVSKEIFCRKPELELDWRGPTEKYAGTAATYFFRVRNPGTAPAEDVTVTATLPAGAEFASASDGQTYDATRRQINWRVGTLGPGDDNYMELKCIVNTPGANHFAVTAANAAGDLKASKPIETNVVALADLKLEVSDPSGPVAVGTQAVYEIHVHNRGANAAKEVNVVGLFSDGIEPDQAEGAMYTVADGRVSFRTIEELPAGRDITLRIRAHAVKAGTHVFRAEVLCNDLEIKLAAEETTRFYSDDLQPAGEQPTEQAASRSSFDSAVR